MGAAYSLGPFLPTVLPLVERQVEWVDARFARHRQWLWRKAQQDAARGTIFYADKVHDDAFLDARAVQHIFELSDGQTLAVMQVFDPKHSQRVLAAEVWSAIILGASMPMKDKVDRLCSVVATAASSSSSSGTGHDSPPQLNLVELAMLFHIATRAFSRLKGREMVPDVLLEDVLQSFRVAYNYGDENLDQEVKLEHVRAFAATDERCRTYLQNLAATVEIKDADNLLDQRTHIQMQMADVAAALAIAKDADEIEVLRREQYKAERRGDADIVLAPHSGRTHEASAPFLDTQARPIIAAEEPSQNLSVARIRRSNSDLHDSFRASKKKQQLAAIAVTDASMLEQQCAEWWASICVGDDR